jgi:hypothetical protein
MIAVTECSRDILSDLAHLMRSIGKASSLTQAQALAELAREIALTKGEWLEQVLQNKSDELERNGGECAKLVHALMCEPVQDPGVHAPAG